MRVGIFCSATSRGGVETVSMNLCRALRQLDHEVVIIAPPAAAGSGDQVMYEMAGVADDLVVLKPAARPLDLIGQLSQRLESESLDVFVPNYRMTTYAACASLRSRSRPRIVGVCHDDSLAYYHMLFHYSDIITGFLCPSLKTYEILSSLLVDRRADIVHIPHCLYWPEASPPGPPTDRIRLLYHGRLVEAQKNVLQLIRLCAVLRGRAIPFRLTMVGNGDAETKCRSLVSELGVEDHVTFLEACGPAELSRLFSSHHVSMLTSNHEGFCISLAEAMSVGLPGIAFSCGGVIEEYLHDGANGFIVPSGDLMAMADRVEFFYRNPDQWATFSARAMQELRRRYDLESTIPRYASLFHRLESEPARERWPGLRPVAPWIEGRRWGSITERLGSLMGLWSGSRGVSRRLAELGVDH